MLVSLIQCTDHSKSGTPIIGTVAARTSGAKNRENHYTAGSGCGVVQCGESKHRDPHL